MSFALKTRLCCTDFCPCRALKITLICRTSFLAYSRVCRVGVTCRLNWNFAELDSSVYERYEPSLKEVIEIYRNSIPVFFLHFPPTLSFPSNFHFPPTFICRPERWFSPQPPSPSFNSFNPCPTTVLSFSPEISYLPILSLIHRALALSIASSSPAIPSSPSTAPSPSPPTSTPSTTTSAVKTAWFIIPPTSRDSSYF